MRSNPVHPWQDAILPYGNGAALQQLCQMYQQPAGQDGHGGSCGGEIYGEKLSAKLIHHGHSFAFHFLPIFYPLAASFKTAASAK